MVQCLVDAITKKAKQKRQARSQQEDWATALGRSQGGRNKRLSSRIGFGVHVALVGMATQIAVKSGFTCDMHSPSALRAKLAFLGKRYIAPTNLAIFACNLHEAAFLTTSISGGSQPPLSNEYRLS
jgi:hypothetical protein